METLVSGQQKLIPEMHIIHTEKQRLLEHQKRLEELLKRPDRTTTTTKSTTTETTTTTKSTTTETTTTTVSTTEQTTTTTKKVPPRRGRNCAEVITPSKGSGIYEIFIPSFREQAIKVACDAETHGGNWTIILKRFDGSVDFYHNWFQYKIGFGTLFGEFFLGLDKLHALTNDMPQELYFILEDFQGDVRYEFYDDFAIGDESEWYLLHTLGRASGTAGDSFSIHHRMYFTTRDRDHDRWIYGNCAIKETGAWWYNDCSNRYTHKCLFGWITFKNIVCFILAT